MTPTQAPSTRMDMAVVVDRLDRLSVQIQQLTDQIECLNREQNTFVVQYTKAHVELEADVKRVWESADRAHQRIDKLTQGVWAIAVPIILMVVAYIWDLITHSGGIP